MKQPPPPKRIPESMGPEEIGPYLRGLREQFELTQQDISERLHIRARYVAAIEEANYVVMPGKVYARGYIQTYAEFLGLDAEQVVAQCFPATNPAAIVTPNTPESNMRVPVKPQAQPVPYTAKTYGSPPVQYGTNWQGFGLAAIALMVAAVGYSVFLGGSGDGSVDGSSTVAPPPESLLSSVRSEVMPTRPNYACLEEETPLGCFFAHGALTQLNALKFEATRPFTAEISAAEAAHVTPPPADEPSHDPE